MAPVPLRGSLLLATLVIVGTCAALIDLDTVVSAQSGVAGRVIDTAGKPLPGVNVMMLPESGGVVRSMTTGTDGQYRFEMVPDGTYRVDFELVGFDLVRRNHVRVLNGASPAGDATLRISSLCECVSMGSLPPVRQRSGRVVDTEGRPLPHARLEIVVSLPPFVPGPSQPRVTRNWRESAYADAQGLFTVRLPVDGAWGVSASDTGFPSRVQLFYGSDVTPVVLTLSFAGTDGLQEYERLDRGCRCPGNLFTHAGR